MLESLYTEALRYVYVLSSGPARVAVADALLVALAAAFVVAAWRLRAFSRTGRFPIPRKENA